MKVFRKIAAGVLAAVIALTLSDPFSLQAYADSTESGISMPLALDDLSDFPADYREALLKLKTAHPNWVFVCQKTGVDWNGAVNSELSGDKSLISKTADYRMRSSAYSKDSNWYHVTREALEYTMDPRNYLTESGIFAFEQLGFDPEFHTIESAETFLASSFMAKYTDSGLINYAPGTVYTYPEIIWQVGKDLQISVTHLCARLIQEQGVGRSALISGKYPGYEGYYNYFNISASGKSDEDIVKNGLTYAKNKGWTNAYLSILGGAQTIASGYIKRGQDTIYLQKFDVDKSDGSVFTHQYMQNITAPMSEAKITSDKLRKYGLFDNHYVFRIPVYENMPTRISQNPASKNGLYQVNGEYIYFSGGDPDIYFNGLAEGDNYTWWVVQDGKGVPDYNDLYHDSIYGWWKIKDGKVDSEYSGVYDSPLFGYWLIENGRLKSEYTDLYEDDEYGWVKIKAGAFDGNFSGLYCSPTLGWWKIDSGKIDREYSDLYCDPVYGWWKIKDGYVDFGYTGIYDSPLYGNWLIANGGVAFGYTDLYNDSELGWIKVRNGMTDNTFSGLYNSPACGWWKINGGKVDFDYDDLYYDPIYGWWKVKDGYVDFGYTGVYDSERYGDWLVGNGRVVFEYNDLFCDKDLGWVKIAGGTVDFGYTGVYNSMLFGTWNIEKGKVVIP